MSVILFDGMTWGTVSKLDVDVLMKPNTFGKNIYLMYKLHVESKKICTNPFQLNTCSLLDSILAQQFHWRRPNVDIRFITVSKESEIT